MFVFSEGNYTIVTVVLLGETIMKQLVSWTSLYVPKGNVSMVRQPIGPTTHWSENPLVRRPIGPKTHWSEDPLVRKSVIGPKTIGPKKCVTGPKTHCSEKVSLVGK